MTEHLQTLLDRIIASPGGPEYAPIIALFLILPFALIIARIIAGDTGRYENPKPEDYVITSLLDEE